ncbi:MAG: DUF393 domain-containing protein [Saprospiraceae bacterium]|nr:DUF393 domain-containing protein [Saprospiraceae bacterium]MCB9321544.1 DUF393 domain-containing protein [Lewinellaceae bacterium]
MEPQSKAYLLYDGICVLCNRSILWVLRHDPKEHIRVAALDSNFAHQLLEQTTGQRPKMDSVLFWKDGKIYDRSSAVLEILAILPRPWRWLWIFRIIPRPWRDTIYDWIARNRYRWFGTYATCPMPSKAIRDRFIL